MAEYPVDLRDKLPDLSEEELLRIATVEQNQHVPEAVALARGELGRRNVSEITRERYEQLRSERERREPAGGRGLPRWLSWAYPPVNDAASATSASRQGVIAAGIVAAITTILALTSMMNSQVSAILGVTLLNLVDASLFALVGFGIWRGSRVAAVSALVLYVVDRAFMWATQGRAPGGLATLLFLGFMNGVRGTYARQRFTARVDSSGNGGE